MVTNLKLLKHYLFVSHLVLFLLAIPCAGQQQNTTINQQEFIAALKISDSGRYVAYRKLVNGKKTVSVFDSYLLSEIDLEYSVTNNVSLSDQYLIVQTVTKDLVVMHLASKEKHVFKNVDKYYGQSDSGYIVMYQFAEKKLNIYNLNTEKELKLSNVCFYSISPEMNQIIYSDSLNQLKWIKLENDMLLDQHHFILNKDRIKKVLWNKADNEAYLITLLDKNFCLYQLKDKKEKKLLQLPVVDELKESIIDTTFYYARITDRKKILFDLLHNVSRRNENPEIWNGNVSGIKATIDNKMKLNRQLAFFDVQKNNWKSFFQKDQILRFELTKDEKFIIKIKEEKNDLTHLKSHIEAYFVDIEEGNELKIGNYAHNGIWLDHLINHPILFIFSDNKWSVFDLYTKNRRKVNPKNSKFFNDQNDFYKMDSGRYIRVPEIWYNDNILFQEKFDVYLYNFKEKSLSNLTNGHHKRKYRYQLGSINNNTKMILLWSTEFHQKEGISVLDASGEIRDLVADKAKYSKIITNGSKVVYLKEKYNKPTALYIYDLINNVESLIYQSNKHDISVDKVHSVYHQWINSEGQRRSAVIRFPEDYNSYKTYPAIFDLYSERYPDQNVYQSPFNETGARINYRRYIKDDYFIIEPDIAYEIGNPGISSAKYIEDVFQEVIKKFNIDSGRVGVFGHSFGGYETNFVISQTNIFKAAVSGSGVSDMVDFYFTFNYKMWDANFFRFESQQWRMGKGFMDIPNFYYDNSPIHQAYRIQTPLLLITGKEDQVIDYKQSVKMFLALKKQNKAVDMVLYPQEGHQLFNIKNIDDMQYRIKSFFDYHLKNSSKPDWLN